jgi:hypothetical protein
MLLSEGQHLRGLSDGLRGPRDQRGAHLERDLACLDLVAQRLDGRRRRPDPHQAGVDDRLGEPGVFRETAVARMHRIRAGAGSDREQLGDVEIRVGRGIALQRVRLVGHARVKRIEVDIGIRGHGAHAVVDTGADDANGDLAAVGDQTLHGGRVVRTQATGLNRMSAPIGICPARSRSCAATTAITG